MSRFRAVVLLAATVTCALPMLVCAGEEAAIVQDFETDLGIQKYPENKPGEITNATEWKADGKQSLKIDAGLMAGIDKMKLSDWSGYSVMRIHAYNPTDSTATIGFELQDQYKTYHERHQNAFGLLPGEHVIEVDFAGGLWRGEENKPYRGKIKTPIELAHISRLSFTNQGSGPIYIDQIEVVKIKKIETAGGFAFQFAKSNMKAMNHFTFVTENVRFDARRGYGLLANGSGLGKGMSFPTPLLGNGLHWPDEGFRVNIPEGGAYIGWIAFERGGFWEDEWSAYSHLTLKNNGSAVHEHDFSPAGMHFFFQDTELTDMSQLTDKLIYPAHAVNTFKFNAAKGENTFTVEVKDRVAFAVRVAGLILAPDTAEGRAFLEEHDKAQRNAIATTFAAQDRGRRKEGRAEPSKTLVAEPLAPGEEVYPRDWPKNATGAPVGDLVGVTGQTVMLNLGVYAKKNLTLTATAAALAGPGKVGAPAISYGRYLPNRPYGVGAIWLEIHHYRPEPKFTVGPDVSRSLLVEYAIPADAAPGTYTGSVTLSGDGEALEIPIKVQVVAVKLAEIPIPVGLFANALPFKKELVDEATWWRLQESLLKEQGEAGLNVCSGGPGIEYKISENGTVSGDDAVKFVHIAQKYGMNKACVSYGGFLPGIRGIKGDLKKAADALKAFEEANQLPPTYIKGYDEPGTEPEKKAVLEALGSATKAGFNTIGYTSEHWSDPLWMEIVKASTSAACNLHNGEWFKKCKELGAHPWIYNNPRDRFGYGINLWRQIKLGCEGRIDWIGCYTQGFAFHNLDGREPSYARFAVHREFGVLKTPSWLSAREGLLDLRIRLALEKAAPADDPALQFWTVDGYQKDTAKWTVAEMDKVRAAMLKRLSELAK